MRKLVLTLLFLVTIITNPNIVLAQTLTAGVTLTTIPNDPEPLGIVTITASSFAIDIDSADLEWKYNGKVVASGTGKKSIKVTAPENGSTAVISVTISGSGINTSTESVVLRPGSVDLLWEAVDSYTPPFYKGKALLPYGGTIRVTAVPGTASPSTSTFKWTVNGIPMQSSSGYGKSSLLFKHQELDNAENVTVETSGGIFSGKSSIDLIPQQPHIVAYENKEGFVDYAKGWLESISIIGTGARIRFEPYFFSSPLSLKNDLDMSIIVDGDKVETSKINEVSLTSNDGSEGELGVEVFTKEYSLQNAKTLFGIIFN
jgi:hypothetical protein